MTDSGKQTAGGEPQTEATALSSMVDYQEDAIVSRTVLEKKTGTVTLFAFDRDQGLSEHTAPFDALVYVFDGEALVTISGRETRVETGQMINMPANEPHALTAATRFKMLLTMIRS